MSEPITPTRTNWPTALKKVLREIETLSKTAENEGETDTVFALNRAWKEIYKHHARLLFQ